RDGVGRRRQALPPGRARALRRCRPGRRGTEPPQPHGPSGGRRLRPLQQGSPRSRRRRPRGTRQRRPVPGRRAGRPVVTATLTLDLAEALLRTELPVMRGRWSRVVALLARQSLEEAIDELWAARLPAMAATSARAQLLCLPEYLDDDNVAADAAHTWGW